MPLAPFAPGPAPAAAGPPPAPGRSPDRSGSRDCSAIIFSGTADRHHPSGVPRPRRPVGRRQAGTVAAAGSRGSVKGPSGVPRTDSDRKPSGPAGRSPRTGTRYSRHRWSVWWRSAGWRCATARLSQTAMSPGSRRCRTVQACPRPVRGSSSGRRRRRTAALCRVCSPNDRPPSGICRAAKWSPMLFGDAGPARTGRVPDRRARCRTRPDSAHRAAAREQHEAVT